MNPRVPVCMMVLAGALVTITGSASADHKQVPVMRIHAESEIMAKPAAVWAHFTAGRNLVTYCPVWKSQKNAMVNIRKVGDVLDYSDQWGNGGRSIVTYVEKEKELRVAHEPTRGDYMCQGKLVLTPTEKGTKVEYWEQYTDESPPTDMAATADKMEKELGEMLAAVKQDCEKPKSYGPRLKVTK